jgi:hypothetical protein
MDAAAKKKYFAGAGGSLGRRKTLPKKRTREEGILSIRERENEIL